MRCDHPGRSPARVGLALLLAMAGPTALRASDLTRAQGGGILNPTGQPENFQEGKHANYALWYEEGTWHVRATARLGQKSEKFSGEIKITGGKITAGNYQELELAAGPKKAKPKVNDRLWLSNDRRTLQFDLHSTGKADSFSFQVSPQASEIEFRLLFNGSEAPERILIGKTGQHPEKVPFVLEAKP